MDLKWIRAVIFQEGYFREFSWWRTEPCRLVRGSAGTPKTTSRSYTPGGFSLLRLPSNPVGKPPQKKTHKKWKTKRKKMGNQLVGLNVLLTPQVSQLRKTQCEKKYKKNLHSRGRDPEGPFLSWSSTLSINALEKGAVCVGLRCTCH